MPHQDNKLIPHQKYSLHPKLPDSVISRSELTHKSILKMEIMVHLFPEQSVQGSSMVLLGKELHTNLKETHQNNSSQCQPSLYTHSE